jgi:hypothetical protein
MFRGASDHGDSWPSREPQSRDKLVIPDQIVHRDGRPGSLMLVAGVQLEPGTESFWTLDDQGRLERAPLDPVLENLASLYAVQHSYFAANHQYAQTFAELKWQPSRESRIAYFLSPRESVQPTALGLSVSISPREYGESDTGQPRYQPQPNQFRVIAKGIVEPGRREECWAIDETGKFEKLNCF